VKIVLDLYCRKGGAARGYQRAGLYVIGVDRDPQPGYAGDEFIQADVIDFLIRMLNSGGLIRSERFGWVKPTLIHASPPCQDGNTATASNRARGLKDDHEQLVPDTRAALDELGFPYVIEQPTSSRADVIRRDLTLCMDMFRGSMPPPWVQKHRSFEISGLTIPQPEHPEGSVRGPSMAGFPAPAGHAGRVRGWRHSQYFDGPYVAAYGRGGGKGTLAEVAHAMDIDWMTDLFDLCEAIPPAFTEYIGNHAAYLNRARELT